LNLAEIDRLKKNQVSKAKDVTIKRPQRTITHLQKAMGLDNNRALYMSCRVSFSLSLFNLLLKIT
jgi:hypothetical protein